MNTELGQKGFLCGCAVELGCNGGVVNTDRVFV